jgi:hypothetical protein
MYTAPDQIQEQQTASTEPHICGLIALKLIAGCAKLLASLGIEYVGFRSWDSVLGKLLLNMGTFFTQALPAAFG